MSASDRFMDTVFSWSLEDIFNDNLYKNQVKKIPESFDSAPHYFGSYSFPLLEETRAKVQSSMETIDRAPFAEVVAFNESKSKFDETWIYNIKVDEWRNRFSERGKEPYKTLPGDLFVLADAKPETVSDLQRVGRSWTFVSVTNITENKISENKREDEFNDEIIETEIKEFKVKASKRFQVNDNKSTPASVFVVFLVNLITNSRIWAALHMFGNLKIIKDVLCTHSVAQENYPPSYEMSADIRDKLLFECSSSGLNESQTGAVLACLEMLFCDSKSTLQLIWGPPGTGKTKSTATLLLTLLRMNCRTLVCAPTNVAVTEVASHLVEMVTEAESSALFCPLGKILLFGNKEGLKVGSDIEDIYLDHRVESLFECLGPVTGWSSCSSSMIGLLEDCVSHYHIFLENELAKEKKQNGDGELVRKGCGSETEVSKGKCKSFLEFFRERFVPTALPLKCCISTFCTHISQDYISAHNFQDMISLLGLVDSFGLLLLQGNVDSEALEELFSRSEVEDVPEPVGDTFHLYMKRRKCLSVLRTLQNSIRGLDLPDVRNEKSVMEFCFQRASLIFCTASSSFKLHRVKMEPLTVVVIDEAAQLKECESTIPLQLPGVKHAVLVGDECQLPATVKSNVSYEAGFGRSLFERLSSMGHSKHLLNMQYRMHPSISSFPNSSFYYNQILDAPNVKRRSHEKHFLPGSMFGPYSFINVIDGREEKDEDGHSPKNMVEVAIALKILQNLYKKWDVSKEKFSIGVISPYAAQVAALQDKLGQKYDKLDGFKVKVNTVDGFQGGEEDIIIMSTVRSNQHHSLGFISNPQRVNVALTRARHCLWILGSERTLCGSESVWEDLVHDAKNRRCFFNADEDKDMAKAILEAKKELDQFDDLLNADSLLFRSSRWKVLFSDNFLKSFRKLKSIQLKKSVLNLLLKLSGGWRPKKKNVQTSSGSSSFLRQYKVGGLYIVCTIDIAKELKYIQVLKVWDILPLEDIPKLVNRLASIFKRYTDDFINRCNEKCLEGNLEVPKCWPTSLDVPRFKDLSATETDSDFVGDASDGRSYVENSQVSESLLLMKFYALSSGVVNHLLSDREGKEMDLPFEVTDQEMEIILYHKSTFIVGRSGTGKTTVLTMKLFQNEQCHHLAEKGCGTSSNSMVEPSSSATQGRTLHQLFVTVSPKLCFAIKQHVLHLKRFACGGSDSTEKVLIDMADFDEEEFQFKDIKDSFQDIPPDSYPLVITFHKFLMMLDGTLTNSYFERFLDPTTLAHGQLRSSRSVALQTFIRTKEVNYERFSSSYWPHFNMQLTKQLDASRVFTEIISHIKGGLGAIEAGDGRLGREDYVELSEGRVSNLSKQKREVIYDIFQAYEKMKLESREFDLADFVIDLHRRIRHEKFVGDQMDFVYIDEVQDLTMSQIALFKHMCNNVEDGFVFSGDTAQTIARGIDFRFQDIRHLFYKKFVLESRGNKHQERKEKGQISEIFHLTQNFRTHAGVLKLSQSIVELLYRFFPLSMDILKPETSLIYGEAPVLLESGEDENAIIRIFGNSGIDNSNIVGFGAEQVILVRDVGAQKEIFKIVGKQALVLTIVECKGLEFQDVLLYNFFGSSPLKNQWRVIYDYMKEQDLLDSTLPQRFPSFSEAKHNILCSELKQLYVAVTRTRQRLWFCENVEELSRPMFDYWKKKCLVQVRQLDDSLAQAMQVASSPEEWKSRGIKLYHEHNYEMATMCFERAGDTYWERRSKAAGLKAIADRMRTSNPAEANTILKEAAEIFDAIGKADSAARCFSDLGEYERAARIYLDKCGDLERAGECFSLAGCYQDAADVYAKGNFFSECLSVCAKGKLFEMGLKYIKYWKQHPIKDSAVARRGEGMDEIEQAFLESCALHYHKLKDNRSMMNFVRAFHSIISMRNFLKEHAGLDELLLLEEGFGNYLEAAEIAKLKGDIILEADFLEKAGKFREASLHILFYVLANSLWSYGSKGWPVKQFSQKEELLSKAKSCAKNETESFYELVCTEVEVLLNEQSNLFVLKNHMNACQRHSSVGGEILSSQKILDAHLSSSADKYVWEEMLVDDLIKCSANGISENQVSMDSLIYFWNFWKDKIAHIFEYLRCLETQEVSEYKSYGEFCLNYLGVWRMYHNLSPVYVLLIPDADWVRGLNKRYFRNQGKLVSVDAHQLASAARNYWSSELLSVGMKVLDKLEKLYKFPIKNADSVFCRSRCLTYICEVSVYLLQSKCLTLRYHDAERLHKCVTFSIESIVPLVFPLDWRNSLREKLISLRQTDASKNVLKQVIQEFTRSKNELSWGQIGKLVMVILGTGKLNNQLYEKLVRKLDCNPPWQVFIENLCGNIERGNTGQEPKEVSVMLRFHEALAGTYNVNWRAVKDYITPGCFLYLLERLLIWASCFQGYAITTSSCFIEWLIYQGEDTSLSLRGADVRPSLDGVLRFVIGVVRDCIFNKVDMVEWIKKSIKDWMNYYSLLMVRLVVVLCLVYLNFDIGLDLFHDILGRNYITEQLPSEFYNALKSRRSGKSVRLDVNVLAAALKKVGNTLVIASFGTNCSRWLCSDAVFVDMMANQSRDDIFRKLFPKPPVLKASEAGSSSRVLCATNSEEGKTGAALDKPCDAGESHTIGEGDCESNKSPKSQQTDVASVPSETRDSHNIGEENRIRNESDLLADAASGSQCTGNKGKTKNKNKRGKNKKGRK
ncbi:hypothetical protein C1H46_025973 [Malus baccata]|uniref:UvrD-like helicase ATP-binding domain-containing protein n=1 Tax=Malus baccata TaxID=106549 RepID=A0A540LQ56_MALBA|nr:hypothetical protein C1H46_025973 [Malus baccata]